MVSAVLGKRKSVQEVSWLSLSPASLRTLQSASSLYIHVQIKVHVLVHITQHVGECEVKSSSIV